MKSEREQTQWSFLEILIIVIAWVIALVLVGSLIIKVRVLITH